MNKPTLYALVCNIRDKSGFDVRKRQNIRKDITYRYIGEFVTFAMEYGYSIEDIANYLKISAAVAYHRRRYYMSNYYEKDLAEWFEV